MTEGDKRAAQEIGEVLERAARAAVYGSREARSGKFEQAFAAEKLVAGKLLREAQAAYQSWANWEAINDAFDPSRDTAKAILHLELEVGTIRQALARDAIIGAFRLSDVFNKKNGDRITLCRFAELANDGAAFAQLSSPEWALDLGTPEFLVDEVANENVERLKRIAALILSDWGQAVLADPEFKDLRETLRPVRDRLAHALDLQDDGNNPTYDQIRRFMTLTLELSTDVGFVFLGAGVPAAEFERFSRKRAKNFWSMAFQHPIDLYHQDMKRRGEAD